MTATRKRHRVPRFFLALLLGTCLAAAPVALANDFAYVDAGDPYSREELARMLAPIALYPDALLAQILMAATYPIEVIEAERWVRMNSHLAGESLDAALLHKYWDPSVKALCHFPSVIALMSERIAETTELGNAFLAQEADVMDMVQELRASAYAQGNLVSNVQQQIIVEKEVIVIQPANPRVIFVPYYDPFYVYGPWWYPAYPPYYWVPSGIRLGVGISYWPGLHFTYAFGSWHYVDWRRHSIHVVVHTPPRFVRHDRWIVQSGPWRHSPVHRRGVSYRDTSTATRYGQPPPRVRSTREIATQTAPSRGRDPRRDARDVATPPGRSNQRELERDQGRRQQPPPTQRDQHQPQRERVARETFDRSRQVEGERQPSRQVEQQRPRPERERVVQERPEHSRRESAPRQEQQLSASQETQQTRQQPQRQARVSEQSVQERQQERYGTSVERPVLQTRESFVNGGAPSRSNHREGGRDRR